MAKFIKIEKDSFFQEAGKPLYHIINKKGNDILARFIWYPVWKRWVCQFTETSVWSDDCLQTVRLWLQELNKTGMIKEAQ